MKNNHNHAKGSASPQQSIPGKWNWHFQALQALRERLARDRDSQREETIQPRRVVRVVLCRIAGDIFHGCTCITANGGETERTSSYAASGGCPVRVTAAFSAGSSASAELSGGAP